MFDMSSISIHSSKSHSKVIVVSKSSNKVNNNISDMSDRDQSNLCRYHQRLNLYIGKYLQHPHYIWIRGNIKGQHLHYLQWLILCSCVHIMCTYYYFSHISFDNISLLLQWSHAEETFNLCIHPWPPKFAMASHSHINAILIILSPNN